MPRPTPRVLATFQPPSLGHPASFRVDSTPLCQPDQPPPTPKTHRPSTRNVKKIPQKTLPLCELPQIPQCGNPQMRPCRQKACLPPGRPFASLASLQLACLSASPLPKPAVPKRLASRQAGLQQAGDRQDKATGCGKRRRLRCPKKQSGFVLPVKRRHNLGYAAQPPQAREGDVVRIQRQALTRAARYARAERPGEPYPELELRAAGCALS